MNDERARWNAAVEETGRQLRRSAELVRERQELADQRLTLFRDVVRAARKFVDDAMPRR